MIKRLFGFWGIPIFELELKSSDTIRYFVGNTTIAGQVCLGSYALAQGGSAIYDGCVTPVPYTKPLYIAGGTCQIISGCCILASTAAACICPPAALVVGGAGWSMNKVGSYIVDQTNKVDPAPSLSKVLK
jgi:hypothetical protein